MGPAARLKLLTLLTFLGALLLFGLEPLVARLLLPACGGSFHVWATCLTFFQGTLLLAYLYCHLLAARLGRWHLAVAALPLLFLPLALLPEHTPAAPLLGGLTAAGVGLADPDSQAPVLSILRALVVGIGLPFGVLATTGVVAQSWLARSDLPGRDDPYPLYAASNVGSLVALLGYPLLVEPFVSLRAQRLTWSALFLGYLAVLALAAPRKAAADAPAPPPLADAPRPAWSDVVAWLGLSAAPSMFLVAVTNVISVDIGSLPLVWVVPLSIYLLSFVLVFGRRPFYPALLRRFWPEICLVGAFMFLLEGEKSLSRWMAVVHLASLFVVCLVGHGELHLARPAPRHLTAFYLVLALGGWLGGAFATLLAPRLFTSLAEYLLALVLLAATFVWRHRLALPGWVRAESRLVLACSGLLVLIIAGRTAHALFLHQREEPVHVRRNAYGIYRVVDRPLGFDLQAEVSAALGHADERLLLRKLLHGTTVHGAQVLHPTAGRWPISYYHREGPLGDAMAVTRERLGGGPMTGGVVGLGAGTTAAYFDRPGDRVTFYELDPDVVDLARTHFRYLADCEAGSGAAPRMVVGDARLRLAHDDDAPAGGYDVLLIDAFSSDAIPLHLLTREALEVFTRRLAPGGLVVFHVSNRYYQLEDALVATARAAGLPAALRSSGDLLDLAPLEDPSTYVALAARAEALEPLLRRRWQRAPERLGAGVTPWTDDYANLLRTLRPFGE
ncbi:MAG: fused MFS/spermidine synthase [Planctomycetota bacterium]|nr:fused MFS/spermidine synthase [Planctomycetota bacterium]